MLLQEEDPQKSLGSVCNAACHACIISTQSQPATRLIFHRSDCSFYFRYAEDIIIVEEKSQFSIHLS